MRVVSDTPWFAPKPHGFGATPTTWQAWVATLVFVVALVCNLALLNGLPRWVGGIILVALYVGLVYLKTDDNDDWR